MGAANSKSKGRPAPIATFPGDPDHGKVVLEDNKSPAKVHRPRFKKRSKCFMDLEIDGEPAGRLIFELRPDINPRTAENFRALCTGEHDLTYKGCKFHKVIPGFVVQSGDVEFKGTKKEGKGGRSIYGRTFADEDLEKLVHDQFGVVSMANAGVPHSSSSQFMIITDPVGADWLDGKHTVFGTVTQETLEVVEKIEECAEVFKRDHKRRARITKSCTIADCGQL